MSANTNIEWCHATVNDWAGCTAVSPACDNCYAKRMAGRLWGTEWGQGKPRYQFAGASDALHALDRKAKRLGQPLRVFHNSLSDFFDNEVPASWRISAMRAIVDTPNLIHILLTKRIGNAANMLEQAFRSVHVQREGWADNVPPNVWIGATIVNQEEADRDIHKLLTVRAAKRFLSMEPLLGPIDLDRWLELAGLNTDLGLSNPGLDWVIVGGESGPHARPMHPDWARILRDQCEAAGVPFLFKQWGKWASMEGAGIAEHGPVMDSCGNVTDWMHQEITLSNGSKHQVKAHTWTGHATDLMFRVGKKAAGRLLDGREWNGVPA